METARHQCMIYEGSPATHLRGLARLIDEKLQANHRCLYLNSPPMVAGIRSYLAAEGVDVAREVDDGSLVLSSDSGHLVNGVTGPPTSSTGSRMRCRKAFSPSMRMRS